jgi:hypothetical protein
MLRHYEMRIADRKFHGFASLLVLITILVGSLFTPFFLTSHAQISPSYAKPGAYALYDVVGGSVAFFTGVQGNISYTVKNVFSNGSMLVRLSLNVTEGDEIAPTYNTYNYTDSILRPKIFPVVPLANLSSHDVTFQNVSCTYVTSQQITVNNLVFQTFEYQGVSNQSTVSFWFDNATGLAIEEASSAGSQISLVSTNVATPIRTVDPINASLPIYIVFVAIFAGTGLGYYEINRYYAKRARKDFKKKLKKERLKERKSEVSENLGS